MVILAKNKQEIKDAFEVRKQVFVGEQKVSEKIVIDDLENQADHFLAYENEKPVGTARIRYLGNETAKIERMAILKNFRGKGIGTELLNFMLVYLKKKNIHHIIMNAQLQAKDFYQKFGFKPVGEVFEEVGIEHIKMEKNI